jgi:multidrug resistance protein MdtO
MKQMLQYLKTELAPQPGKFENVLRITILSVLLVILLETFQTPLPAYSAYILFFISKEEASSTILTGILATLAVTISVFLTIAIYMISADEPGLRLPLMATIVFAGMFISRASSFGPIAFLTGFLVTIALTLVDLIPIKHPLSSANLLTRSVLWLWVVVMLPVGLVIVANALTGRNPADLFEQGIKERLKLAACVLSGHVNPNDQKKLQDFAESSHSRCKFPKIFENSRREWLELGTADLFRYLRIPDIFSKKLHINKKANEQLLANVGKLNVLLMEWQELKVSEPELVDAASKCGAMLLKLAKAIETKAKTLPSIQKFTLPTYLGNTVHERKAFLLLATIMQIIEGMPSLWNSRTIPDNSTSKPEKKTFHFLVPDAFTNPDYTRYALKTTLAIFIAYMTYNLLNWPAIRTCMITCFFVSLGTFGETVQKMILRIIGALIGGGIGLLSVIFIMPYLTTIMGLSMITAVMAFFAAWVAASSERLSYAGLQIVLAFFLSILVGYGPTVDLTEARDRVVGVLLGNIIIFLVYTMIWPTSVVAQARFALAKALNKLSQMMAMTPVAFNENQTLKDALFLAFSEAISQAKRLISFDPFEPQYIQHEKIEVDIALKDTLNSLCGPMIILGEQSSHMPLTAISSKEMATYCQLLSDWFCSEANLLLSDKESILPLPQIEPLIRSFEYAAGESSWLLAYSDWYHTLDERVHQLEALIRTALDFRRIPLSRSAIKESI